MNRFLLSFLLSFLLLFSFSKRSEAQLTLAYPLWELTVGTSSTVTPTDGVYTNIFCSADRADFVTFAFFTSTGANFYSTFQFIQTNGQFSYLSSYDTALITEAQKMVTLGAGIGGSVFISGLLKVIFQYSERGNLNVIDPTTLTTATVNGVANTPVGDDPLQKAAGTVVKIPATKGNNAGCFVDVIAPRMNNASFSIPSLGAQPQY